MNNLVIKGESKNTKFPAVDSANFPRLALYDGTYIPLVEDDGSDGTTLKIRIGDKVYRLDNGGVSWEIFFDWVYSSNGQMIIVDSNFNVLFFSQSDSKPFTSTFFKVPSSGRDITTALQEYIGGGIGANVADDTYIGSYPYNADTIITGGGTYERFILAQKNQTDTLPFEEVGLSWFNIGSASLQAFIVRKNKKVRSWATPSVVGDYFIYTYESPKEILRSRVLFKGKVRLIRGASNVEIIDFDGLNPIVAEVSPSGSIGVSFAIKDKSFTNYPFETVICDNRNRSQVVFDMYDTLKTGTKVPDTLQTYKAIGDYLDITSDFFDAPYSCTFTAKKDCTLLAIKQDPTDYLVKITRQDLITGDTLNYSGYSVTGVYTLLAFQDETELPDEIGWSHVYNRDNYGYFYNSITKQAERDTGTYLRKNGYATEKYTNFDGDLIIQNAYGYVQKLDGHDSWSQTFFQGFAMVFLEKDSTLTVNTTAGDDIMLFDKDGTLLDDQIADSEGVVTFTVPTTKLGRSYKVQSATTGQSSDITVTGNESVNLTPSAQLPDFEVMWAYQFANDAGMISGNPDTGLVYNYKPYSEFKGKMLKQVCATTYRAPFSIIGQRSTQYNVYQIDVEIVNGEGLRMCWACINPGHTTILFDGDVRTLITAKTYFHRDTSPFSNTETVYYDSNTNISYFSPSATLITPVIKEPPCVKVWDGSTGLYDQALSAARTYFNSKPNYAVTTQLEEDVRCGDVGGLPEYSSYAQNYLVSQTFPARTGAYNRLIFARKDVKYPSCEMAFLWYTGGPTEACIVKQNNEQVIHATTMTGDFITIANSQSITIAAFAGKIKYKLNNNQMITMDASNGLSLTMSTDLQGISCFFCYPDMPNKYVIYQGISAGNVTDNRYTFKGAPKSAVTIAYTNGNNWEYGVAYDSSISATVTYDMDYKNTNNVWVNTRSNVSANHQSSNTYKIIGKTGAFTSTYSQNDAQFTGTSFEDVAQKVRQYFDS